MADSGTLVRIADVHKFYSRGNERVDVLKGVNFTIPKGDFLALMGPSGSGKTTLLNLMGGLDQPTSGAVEIGGVRINELSGSSLSKWRSRHIGFVFQLYNLLPVLNAERNVELPLLLTNLSRAERRKRAQLALKVVGLADRMSHYPASFRRPGAAGRIAGDVTDPDCCSATSRPALDRKSATRSDPPKLNRDHGKTIVMVTTTARGRLRPPHLHLRRAFNEEGVPASTAAIWKSCGGGRTTSPCSRLHRLFLRILMIRAGSSASIRHGPPDPDPQDQPDHAAARSPREPPPDGPGVDITATATGSAGNQMEECFPQMAVEPESNGHLQGVRAAGPDEGVAERPAGAIVGRIR
jgi:putative ABC transport system ATP-binding protein